MPGPAQGTKAPRRIGALDLEGDAPPELFLRGLAELGYVEGQNIVIEYRSADNQRERLPELAVELVGLDVEVIVPFSRLSVLAAKQATDRIPIVFGAGIGDPVGEGLAASLARPGGNVTGPASAPPEANLKRLDLLLDAVPGVARVGVLGGWLFTPGLSPEQWEAVARPRGVTLLNLPLAPGATGDQVRGAFAAAAELGADALVRTTVGSNPPEERLTADLARETRLPAMFPRRSFVDAGGLMAYDVRIGSLALRASGYVDKILRGANPAELPIERPAQYDLFINLTTAADLGLTIPEAVLAQATEVIR